MIPPPPALINSRTFLHERDLTSHGHGKSPLFIHPNEALKLLGIISGSSGALA